MGLVPEEYKKTDSKYRQEAYSTDRVIVGINYPPFHVGCRTNTSPAYETTDIASMSRAARDANGKYITVPASMTYEEWYETYIENSRENVIMKAAKKNKIRGKLNIPPSKIDISSYYFDDAHINKQREHNVTKEDAVRFVKDAKVSFTKLKLYSRSKY